MSKSTFHIDFNEMLTSCNLIKLSKTDFKKDINGNVIQLKEGLEIMVIMEDIDEFGQRDDLIANGTVERNSTGLSKMCKWIIRIDEKGIRNKSALE